MSTIKDICTKDKLIRSNYYSDTYRVEYTRHGVRKTMDAMHISIPFSAEKEIILKERFGYTAEELTEFYSCFGKNVQNHVSMSESLLKKSNVNIDLCSVYIDQKTAIGKPNKAGTDIYIITEPMEPLVGETSMISNRQTTFHNILTLGIRFLQMLKVYHENSVCVGAVDLDSFYIAIGDDKKRLIKDGYFLYSKEGDSSVSLTKDALTFLPPDVRNGTAGITPDSDFYAVCALLWTLLDGQHYTQAPDLTRPPKYAPPELAEALKAALANGESERKNLSNVLRVTKESIRDGIIEFEAPDYSARLNEKLEEYRRMHMEIDTEEEEEPSYQGEEYDPDEELAEDNTIFLDTMSKPKKIISGAAIVILSAAVIAGSLFAGKILGERGWGSPAPPTATIHEEPVPEATETPAPTEKPEYTPAPAPTSNPITGEDYPELLLDTGYEWFRSEYPATDFCAIDFENSYEISDEIIERWNFYLDNNSVTCYVYKRPAFKTDINCSPEGGDKVLVISGNGAGKMNVAMRQNELAEYMAYKFSYGVLNGLSALNSTGSTPFSIPVITHVPEETEPPAPVETENSEKTAPEREEEARRAAEEQLRLEQEQRYQQELQYQQQTQAQNSGYYPQGGGGSGYQAGTSSSSAVQTPDWNNSDTWEIEGGSWGNEPQTTTVSDGGIETQFTTYNLVLYATNSVIHVGESTEIYNAGNTGLFTSVMSSNMQAISVSTSPDANGHYRVTGLNPGTADISVMDQYGYSSRITIQCVPNN